MKSETMYKQQTTNKYILMLILIAIPTTSKAFDKNNIYFGSGYTFPNIAYEKDYGDGFLPDSNSGYELFSGYQINNLYGIESSFSWLPRHTRQVMLIPGDGLPGIPGALLPGEFEIWETTFSMMSLDLALFGKYPVDSHNCFELYGSMGFSVTYINATIDLLDDETGPSLTASERAAAFRKFSQYKLIPTINAGFQYQLLNNFKLRCLLKFSQNSRFKHVKPNSIVSNSEIRMKNSVGVHISLLFYL